MKNKNLIDTTQLRKSINESLGCLAHAVDDQGASETFRQYLDTLARFHRYSWKNCLLILMQKPESTRVAGFTAWKELGRSVKPGEKVIRIFAPCPYLKKDVNGETEERVYFRTACVFDLSQTEGKDLADFELPIIETTADDLLKRLEQVAENRNIKLKYVPLEVGH